METWPSFRTWKKTDESELNDPCFHFFPPQELPALVLSILFFFPLCLLQCPYSLHPAFSYFLPFFLFLHQPTNREESRVSRIDLSLRFMIEGRLSAGMRVSEVMTEVAKWNRTHGYSDHHNRRFFPTRQDIQQIALSLRRLQRSLHPSQAPRRKTKKYDTPGKDGASKVLRGELREWCVFHQSRTTAGPSPRPLIVVLQNGAMKEGMQRWGKDVVCVDKNYEGVYECFFVSDYVCILVLSSVICTVRKEGTVMEQGGGVWEQELWRCVFLCKWLCMHFSFIIILTVRQEDTVMV